MCIQKKKKKKGSKRNEKRVARKTSKVKRRGIQEIELHCRLPGTRLAGVDCQLLRNAISDIHLHAEAALTHIARIRRHFGSAYTTSAVFFR